VSGPPACCRRPQATRPQGITNLRASSLLGVQKDLAAPFGAGSGRLDRRQWIRRSRRNIELACGDHRRRFSKTAIHGGSGSSSRPASWFRSRPRPMCSSSPCQQQKAGGLNSRGRLRGGHPRSLPPVAFSTCATSRFENPSISASVRVRSWGCSTTVIAIDFLPSSGPAPS
jgi:hypothetical protein